LIRAHPLGALVTTGPDGLVANHFPFIIDAAASPLGTLRAHMARANDQWRTLDGSREALVIFQGAYTYITPSWYATKAETGKVVPTWNYTIVLAHGTLVAHEEPGWLVPHVRRLVDRHEAHRVEPWSIDDAPDGYIETMVRAIVGLELRITRLEAKRKLSQNRSIADIEGVIEGLAEGTPRERAVSADMAAVARSR
jgi:transcriptional regulator